ncbi:MAG: aldehyde ferredoxin oxidoreductase, partial [Desulfobulbaceae bacterium]|nr:aldehyde ferredoxin oxidoreductase [Desulfobulbaceae bacterium]
GLAALLFEKYGQKERSWSHADQPFILAIGPLTGAFPLMSKTVAAFKSPYHDQYTESHAGGRSALALKFADLDGLVITGRAGRLSSLEIGSRSIVIKDVSFMKGMDAYASGKLLRRMSRGGSGHRSILRIGPSGEIGSAMACINADTYRHFGRLGGGAVLGNKNLKGTISPGDGSFGRPDNSEYKKLFARVYEQVTATRMMHKYHSLGTPANLQALDDIKSLPWRNLQQTSDPEGIKGINGQRFADDALLRNGACSGCPVGCIHIGYVREKFSEDNRYIYRQVAYDYEPVFSCGTMLGVTETFDVLNILDVMEKVSLDSMSGGVALAWATEASARGLISEKETIVKLAFGEAEGYRQAARYLGTGANTFYRLLGQGTLKAAEEYGGAEFGCVLGQEMAGYATGELFFAAQSLGFRHSHLDTGGYSYDQKHEEKDVDKAVDFLMADEPGRCLLTSMVSCLFARSVYTEEVLGECLHALGYGEVTDKLAAAGERIRARRWRLRFATGFKPEDIVLPKRFYKVTTWKGPVDGDYLDGLRREYGRRLTELVKEGVDSET